MAVSTGCSDYLDTLPGDKYDDASVWGNAVYTEQFVFNIYQGIPYPYQWYMSGALVDEQVPNQVDGIVTRVTESNLTPDDLGAFADNWGPACKDGGGMTLILKSEHVTNSLKK